MDRRTVRVMDKRSIRIPACLHVVLRTASDMCLDMVHRHVDRVQTDEWTLDQGTWTDMRIDADMRMDMRIDT